MTMTCSQPVFWVFCCLIAFLVCSITQARDEDSSSQCKTGATDGGEGQCEQQQHLPLFSNERNFYINGTWVEPTRQSLLPVIDPSTADTIATISLGSQDDVDAAVDAANQAFPEWSAMSIKKRQKFVERLLRTYRDGRHDMAKLISMEMGAPIDFALDSQVGAGSYYIKDFLRALEHFETETLVPGVDPEEAQTTILYEPIGVVSAITPWNWPMNQVVLKVIPALLVGCTVILKPSEVAPLSSMLFAQFVHDAGFPPGVFNLINGDGATVGTQLTQHESVAMVSFTGSTRAGKLVAQNAGLKRVALELGGKGANLLFDDVKALERKVRYSVWNCFDNSGQSCNAPTRLLVQSTIYDEAIEIARAVASDVQVASAHEEGDHLGPVVSKVQYDRIQAYIQSGIDQGAWLVVGGLGRPDEVNPLGYYVRPTVFANVTNDMKIAQEEIFGPVLTILKFDNEDEAIAIANDSPYGLTHYAHTTNKKRIKRLARALNAGMVQLNGMGQDDGAPFGGIKSSGYGREGGVYGLHEFCITKAVTGI